MSRAGQATGALAVAVVLGVSVGWALHGGGHSSAAKPSTTPTSSAASSALQYSSPLASPAPSNAVPESSAVEPAPTVSESEIVTAGSVTVTADPLTAKPYQAIEVSGTVEGATPGTTLQFARQDGDTLATTQVGRAGAYRLTVKLGRSGTFVVRAVDGTTVLATSNSFAITVR